MALLSVRCSTGADSDDDEAGTGGLAGAPRENNDIDIGSHLGGAGSTNRRLDPLCGVGECVPDVASSCEDSFGGAGGMIDSGMAGGVPYDPGDLAGQGLSCRVAPPLDCEGGDCAVERSCGQAGASEEAEPCVVAADCAAGLACVGEGAAGSCRPYCCRGSEASCEAGFFCDERRLAEHAGVYVPVCMPVDDCPLTDPYPCPEGQECACQDGRACVVVRADGATACTQPGAGQTGDPCTGTDGAECAYGFVCSPSAGCMKLCSTVAEDSDCPGGGTCQSPSEFPEDLGVCVGASSGSAATK